MSELAEFHFLRPLWLLALLPLLGVVWQARRRRGDYGAWRRVCDEHLLSHVLTQDTPRRRVPMVLLFAGWLLAVLALSGPSWSRQPQPVYETLQARVLVLDLSLSMDSNDLRPSRLARARFKTLDILRGAKEGSTALLVYAAHPYVVSPLTNDANTIAEMVPVLTTSLMPSQGSRLEPALLEAERLLDGVGAKRGSILVITDGLRDKAPALNTARRLRAQGHRISVLGVGTADGAPIPLATGGFLTDADGAIVIPQLADAPLRELAQAGGGAYAGLAGDDADLDVLLDTTDPARSLDTEQSERSNESWLDQGPWLVAGLLPLAAFGFRRGWLLMLVALPLAAPRPSLAVEWSDLWLRVDQQGRQAFAQGDPSRAAELFEDPAWKGSAYYRAGDLETAAKYFSEGATPDDHYNLGNARALAGDLKGALDAYDSALATAPGHDDALFNRELVAKLLEQSQGQRQPERGGGTPNPDDQQGDQPQQATDEGEHDSDGSTQDEGSAAAAPGTERDDTPRSEQATGDGTDEGGEQSSPERDGSNTDDAREGGNKTQRADSGPEDAPPLGSKEAHQALQQWLRKIPDDPGGLLRRKIYLEHRRLHADTGHSEQPW